MTISYLLCPLQLQDLVFTHWAIFFSSWFWLPGSHGHQTLTFAPITPCQRWIKDIHSNQELSNVLGRMNRAGQLYIDQEHTFFVKYTAQGHMVIEDPLVLNPSHAWASITHSWPLVLGSWLLALGSWLLTLDSWFLSLVSWLLALGSWLLILGSWLLTPDSWLLTLDSRLLTLASGL